MCERDWFLSVDRRGAEASLALGDLLIVCLRAFARTFRLAFYNRCLPDNYGERVARTAAMKRH